MNNLDWQYVGGRPYDRNTLSGRDLKDSAEGIKIIHENINDSKSFKDAHKLLDDSEKIYFFGFGYNKTNLERLKISDYLDRTIQGTSAGLLNAESVYARKLFDQKITLFDYDTLGFLRTHFDFE